MYFIGVTTGRSSIMNVFPRWAEHLGLGGPDRVRIQGIDCKWHDDPAVYRRVVEFIRDDPLSRGALVTTHKIDLLNACQDLFDQLDPHATLMGEISSISKRGEELIGHAKDMVTSGLAADAFVPRRYFVDCESDVLVFGAGGSSIAYTSHLLDPARRADAPERIIVTNRSPARLEAIQRVHEQIAHEVPVEYVLTPETADNDAQLARLKPGSLVANATGLGKDAPGSPISDAALFPERGFAWDFNYRGDLRFLEQARSQASSRGVRVEDGWTYFLHGWTRVIAEVFDLDIPTSGPGFDALAEIAASTR
ncbi:MAG: shikimate dehydrogenase [Planctomycetota bacterium]